MPRPCLWRLESPTSIIQILAEGKYFCSHGHGEEVRPAGRSQPDGWPLTGLPMSFRATPTWRSALGLTPGPGCCSPGPVHEHAAQHHMTANAPPGQRSHLNVFSYTFNSGSVFKSDLIIVFYQLSLVNNKKCFPVCSQWNSHNNSAACFSLLASLSIYFCLLLFISISRTEMEVLKYSNWWCCFQIYGFLSAVATGSRC